jgi:hypothetical protein
MYFYMGHKFLGDVYYSYLSYILLNGDFMNEKPKRNLMMVISLEIKSNNIRWDKY